MGTRTYAGGADDGLRAEPGQGQRHGHGGRFVAGVGVTEQLLELLVVGCSANPRPAVSWKTYPECIQPRSTETP
jgi:hypothetical protein